MSNSINTPSIFDVGGSSGGGTPGGTSGQIQYNNAGSFGGYSLGNTLAVNNGVLNVTSPLNAQGSGTSYTIQATDMGKTVTHSSSSAVAVTLPQAGTTGFGAGMAYAETNLGAGIVTITPVTSSISYGGTGTASLALAKGQSAYIISDGTNYTAIVTSASSGGGGNTFTTVQITNGGTAIGGAVPTNGALYVIGNSGTANRLYIGNSSSSTNQVAYFSMNPSTSTGEFSTYDYGLGAGLPLYVNANGGLIQLGTFDINDNASNAVAINGALAVGNPATHSAGPTNGIAAAGAIVSGATIQTAGYNVSTLPAGTKGMRAYVNDQTAACPAVGVGMTGGGSVVCPVFYNGTAWVSG